MPNRLAIVCTHPIQYYAPVFRQLAEDETIEVRVFFGWEGQGNTVDPGFGKVIKWDVPLLDGYDHQFVKNVALDPGTHHFKGIDNPGLASEILAWNPDAVMLYGWRFRSHLSLLRTLNGQVPILFRGDSTLLDDQPGFKSWARHRVLRWVYSHVDAALYVGSNNRDYFLASGMREDQLFFAPHAVNNEWFAKDDASREAEAEAKRRDLGICKDQVVVLFPGKLEPKKQPGVLVEAHKQISSPNVHLVFAGSGPLEADLKSLANARTHFLGFQNQTMMPSVYRMADVVCLPSRYGETWGLALNEAMACGRAVMASDRVGAAVDLVVTESNGWIFDANDPQSIAACLREATVMGKEELSQRGQASRAHVNDWSIPRQAAAIAEAVNKVKVG
jgi:glycosyltransferase involved in cell wall biosynthesis